MDHGLEAGNEVDVQRATNMPGGLDCQEGDNSKKEGWHHSCENHYLPTLGVGLVGIGKSSKVFKQRMA